ncbi:MAG: hypothetical protein GXP36_09010 [Actinobacteria bacterium]|nr:hypothetical protein [Actinomycetota bacterium]
MPRFRHYRLTHAAAAVLLVAITAGTAGAAANSVTVVTAPDAPPPEPVVLISATTLDRTSTTQTFTLTAVNVSPTATGETLVPSSAPRGWTIVSTTPDTEVVNHGFWLLPPLSSGATATVTIEARP